VSAAGQRSAKVIANALSAGFVRREALWFEWRWETFAAGSSQRSGRSWGQPDPGGAGEGGSSPDKAGTCPHCQRARVR
ncbi:MAG: hypothetical protein M3256_23625, partial [Actinomycetota bacterium]|nr:hypothetical protein [Actinomycetota bacterium]